MLMKSKTLNKNIKLQDRTSWSFIMVISNKQLTHVMLKLLLLLVNMISAIGTGAGNTPLLKHFHKHFFSHCSRYIRSTLHNPNKHKSINPIITS